MKIHQILVGAHPGDAITNSAELLQSELRNFGESEIYAHHFDPNLCPNIRKVESFTHSGSETDVIVFHASHGDDVIYDLLHKRPEKLAIIYHNITPGNLIEKWQPDEAKVLDKGRKQVADLAAKADKVLAVSEYNASDLRSLGVSNVRVVPLICDAGRVARIENIPSLASELRAQSGPKILCLGRIFPHKRQDLVVNTFKLYRDFYEPQAQLIVIGTAFVPEYGRHIDTHIERLNLSKSVHMAGRVSEAELATYLTNSDVLICASEHEGVGVPLLEAMSVEVPVLARDFGAISETAGDGAVVAPRAWGARELASAMDKLVSNEALRRDLVSKGLDRSHDWEPSKTIPKTIDQIKDLT